MEFVSTTVMIDTSSRSALIPNLAKASEGRRLDTIRLGPKCGDFSLRGTNVCYPKQLVLQFCQSGNFWRRFGLVCIVLHNFCLASSLLVPVTTRDDRGHLRNLADSESDDDDLRRESVDSHTPSELSRTATKPEEPETTQGGLAQTMMRGLRLAVRGAVDMMRAHARRIDDGVREVFPRRQSLYEAADQYLDAARLYDAAEQQYQQEEDRRQLLPAGRRADELLDELRQAHQRIQDALGRQDQHFRPLNDAAFQDFLRLARRQLQAAGQRALTLHPDMMRQGQVYLNAQRPRPRERQQAVQGLLDIQYYWEN